MARADEEIKLSLTFFEAIEVGAALEAYVAKHKKIAPRSVADAESVLRKLGILGRSAKSLQRACAKSVREREALKHDCPDALEKCVECREQYCDLYDYDGAAVHRGCLKKQVRRGR